MFAEATGAARGQAERPGGGPRSQNDNQSASRRNGANDRMLGIPAVITCKMIRAGSAKAVSRVA